MAYTSRKLLTNKEIRKRNLSYLSQKEGGHKALAQKIDTSESYLSQILRKNAARDLGDSVARRIESAYGYARGWCDTPHPELYGDDNHDPARRPDTPHKRQAPRITPPGEGKLSLFDLKKMYAVEDDALFYVLGVIINASARADAASCYDEIAGTLAQAKAGALERAITVPPSNGTLHDFHEERRRRQDDRRKQPAMLSRADERRHKARRH